MIVGIVITGGINAIETKETKFGYGLGCLFEEINATNISFVCDAPPYWDWRDYDIMTPVKNQGACGSCVAFACIGAFEAVIKWKTDATLDLSEAHLFFCGGGDCNYGWYVSSALNYLKLKGVCDEECFPYDGAYYGENLPCEPCPNWEEAAFKIDKWGYVTGIENIKNALITYGPLIVTFLVYSDFVDYWNNPYKWKDAIYYHKKGTALGGHAVVLVGYNDIKKYWICRNSWGTRGGLNGYFKISYKQCGIDDGAFYIIYSSKPIADANGPYKAKPGEEIQFNGSAYGGKLPYKWQWDFGDGNISYEQNPKHAYSKAGVYAVKLIVEDANGSKGVDVTQAIINYPPEKPIIKAPASVRIYKQASITIKAIDVDGDMVKFTVEWGDGSKTTTDYVASGDEIILNHSWRNYGKYEIKVIAEDEKGDTSQANATIEVGVSDPPYKPFNPSPPNNATGVNYSIALKWEGGDPNGDEVFYTVLFGEENLEVIAKNITNTSIVVSNLKPYTRYKWQILAIDEYGMKTYGDVWSFTTKDETPPIAKIIQPEKNRLYIFNYSISWFNTFVIGKIKVIAYAFDNESGIEKVEFYVDGKLIYTAYEKPYEWIWDEKVAFAKHLLEVIAYNGDGDTAKDSMEVTVFNLFPTIT